MIKVTKLEKIERIKTILAFCRKKYRSLAEISDALGGINKNTLRTTYLYPLVKDGLLSRNEGAIKRNTKYLTTKHVRFL
jgi:DNA-binding HxlR family transcriptional regulator